MPKVTKESVFFDAHLNQRPQELVVLPRLLQKDVIAWPAGFFGAISRESQLSRETAT